MALNEMHSGAVAGIVDRVVTRYRRDPSCMVQILREVQEACDWISPEAIDRLQTTLGVPRTKIEGVAGFYSFFYTRPRGKYRVLFSDNITDRMLGNKEMMDRLCNSLWVERGMKWSLFAINTGSIEMANCTATGAMPPCRGPGRLHGAGDGPKSPV